MDSRWLLTLLLAPVLSPAAFAAESFSLYLYLIEADTTLEPGPDRVVKGEGHGR